MMGYPVVQIVNTTNYTASGTVDYPGFFCSNDNYEVWGNQTWSASSRGLCLVATISAVVVTPNGDVVAEQYSSSGTGFSQFEIVQTGENSFAVVRPTNPPEEEVVLEYSEPTEMQK